MSLVIILMGPQGSGKGTQSQMLSEKLNLPVIATGDMLRQIAQADTELGRKVRAIQEAGQLVPDDVLAQIIKERTGRDDCQNGYILDGFPRTIPQAEFLEEIAQSQGHKLIVIGLQVGREELMRRLLGRRVCSACGAIYNIYSKPSRNQGVCDLDGQPLLVRSDDTQEAIANRLALYDEKTRPILDYYGRSGRLRQVEAEGAPAEVFARIMELLAGELQ
jgi:adenylate kinase